MSTKMISGWWSVILASASKPSSARMTLQPACTRKISALRRIVFESSITSTLTPARFAVSPTLSTSADSSVFDSDSPVGPYLSDAAAQPHALFHTIQPKLVKTKPCTAYFRIAVKGARPPCLGFGCNPTDAATGMPELKLDHLEILFSGAALGASPIHRDLFPARSGRYSLLGQARSFVVDETADQAHPGFEFLLFRHQVGMGYNGVASS